MSKTTIIIWIVIATIGAMAYAQVDIDNRQEQEIEDLRECIRENLDEDNTICVPETKDNIGFYGDKESVDNYFRSNK